MTKGTTVADQDLAPDATDPQAQGPAPELLPNDQTDPSTDAEQVAPVDSEAPAEGVPADETDAPAEDSTPLPANDAPEVADAIDAKVELAGAIGPDLANTNQIVANNDGWTVQSAGFYEDPSQRPGYVVTKAELPDLNHLADRLGVSPEAFLAGLVVAEDDAARDYIQGATAEAKAEALAEADLEAAQANVLPPQDNESVAEEDQGVNSAPVPDDTPAADSEPTPAGVPVDGGPTEGDAADTTESDSTAVSDPALEEAQANADAQADIPADAPKVDVVVEAPADAPAEAPADSEPAASPSEAQSENA